MYFIVCNVNTRILYSRQAGGNIIFFSRIPNIYEKTDNGFQTEDKSLVTFVTYRPYNGNISDAYNNNRRFKTEKFIIVTIPLKQETYTLKDVKELNFQIKTPF